MAIFNQGLMFMTFVFSGVLLRSLKIFLRSRFTEIRIVSFHRFFDIEIVFVSTYRPDIDSKGKKAVSNGSSGDKGLKNWSNMHRELRSD